MLESESSSKHLGAITEDTVARFLKSQDYQIISQNKKIAGVEIDLIVFKNHPMLVEVKRLRSMDEAGFRVRPQQIKRLLFAHQFVLNHWPSADLKIAFVCGNEVFLLDIADICDRY